MNCCVFPLRRLLALSLCALVNSGSAFGEDTATSVYGLAEPVSVLYVTDRKPIALENGAFSYGAERSHSLAFGSINVVGHDAAEAVIDTPSELGRFPETPYPLEKRADGVRRSPAAVAEHQRAVRDMQGELRRRISATSRKEVIVFIHGYNNSFDDAVKGAAQLCSDVGPSDFTCVALTWPAGGSRGFLFGYNVDRESGEFAVADIRKAIRIIAATPGVRGIHFVAHSRGTDVLSSALQQLGIEAYVSQVPLPTKLKISNIILAAPDIDLDVAFSKIIGAVSDPDLPYGKSPNPSVVYDPGKFRFTVYSSNGDKALSLSKALFGSDMRLGLLDGHADPEKLQISPHVAGLVDFISVEDGGGFIGHSYFLASPAMRRDLVAVIRDQKGPSDPSRALIEVKPPFWFLPSRPQTVQ